MKKLIVFSITILALLSFQTLQAYAADNSINLNSNGYIETINPIPIGPTFSVEFKWLDPWPKNPNSPFNVIGPNYWGSDTGGVGLFEFLSSPSDPQNNMPIYYAGIDYNGRMFLYSYLYPGRGYVYSNSNFIWTQGQQYNLYYAVGSDGTIYFGQNGVIESVSGTTISGGTGYFYLGTGYTAYALGEINELRISTDVRYFSDYSPLNTLSSDSNTILLAHMDEGTGTVTVDSSGNGNTLSLLGDASWILGTTPPQLTALSPATVWIGLKNSDDVGIKFDLMAEAYQNEALIGSGQLNGVISGSSGFNKAKVYSIPLTLSAPVSWSSGSILGFKLYVRNTCSGNTHNSGTARLWFNDVSADSFFDATIGGIDQSYYLWNGYVLNTIAGPGPKMTIDIAAGRPCSPFKLFGTWIITP